MIRSTYTKKLVDPLLWYGRCNQDKGSFTSNAEIKVHIKYGKNSVTRWVYKQIIINRATNYIRKQPFA